MMRQRPRRVPVLLQTFLCGGLTYLGLLGLAACARGVSETVVIDWVDVVQFGGIRYLAKINPSGRAPTDADVGPVFATVRFKVADNVHDPGYRLKDGDATFLDVGTPVYSVSGYAPTFRLVARSHLDGRLLFYEADTNPHAHSSADVLDIGGKVRSIGVNSQQDGTTELGVVKDPTQVLALVTMVLDAHVNQGYQERDSATYFVAFHMDDGTAVTRAFWRGSGELERGIFLPPAFGDALQRAVAARAAG
jgi:hypothetical protein